MASRPPLGISLADILGQSAPAPKLSKGQMILGILGDALSGATGGTPTFGALQAKQRQDAQEEAQWGRHLMAQKALERAYPDPSPIERDVTAYMGMDPAHKAAYADLQKAREGDPIVTITLPNGQMYSGPRSGLAAAMMGGGSGTGAAPTPARPEIGATVPLKGGPQGSPLSGPFPNVGPYKRY